MEVEKLECVLRVMVVIKEEDQMQWKVVNQTVKIVKKKRRERGYLSDIGISI